MATAQTDNPVVPELVSEVMKTMARIQTLQLTGTFQVPFHVDEYSLLFANEDDLNYFCDRIGSAGLEQFREEWDHMQRSDDWHDPGFDVHFRFIRLNELVRIECMSVNAGSAFLHSSWMAGNTRYAGVFHASYKLPTLPDYLEELERLADVGLEMSAEYTNSYGRFSYWQIEPHLPYFKPRVNTRDS